MKHSLPLIAVLAASLATPVLAQDINDMMNPRAMIAELGLGDLLDGASTHRLGAPRVVQIAPAEIAALDLDTTVLSSPRPLLRPSTYAINELERSPAGVPTTAGDAQALIAAMGDAPAANTLVANGTNTAVINGTNTAVIASGPAAEPERRTLWQRIFGN